MGGSAKRDTQRESRRLGSIHDICGDLFRRRHLSAVPPAPALQLIGDRWALLTIRELSFGVTRFNEIQTNTGAPRASLTARLRELEDAGLVERRRYNSRPPRDEYVLTPAGRELGPVLRELRVWGERHATPRASGTTR
jgi:DNA-binding HxlR family transcriptional regulator